MTGLWAGRVSKAGWLARPTAYQKQKDGRLRAVTCSISSHSLNWQGEGHLDGSQSSRSCTCAQCHSFSGNNSSLRGKGQGWWERQLLLLLALQFQTNSKSGPPRELQADASYKEMLAELAAMLGVQRL